MKRIVTGALFAAFALTLAACDKGPKQNGQTAEQGENTQVPGTTAAVGTALPDNKPSYIEIFPGAEIVAVIANPIGSGNASAITLKTAAPLQDVADFYRKSIAKAGFANKGEINMAGVVTISGEKGENTYSVLLGTEDGHTTIQLMYK